MKKILLVTLLIVAIVASLAACNDVTAVKNASEDYAADAPAGYGGGTSSPSGGGYGGESAHGDAGIRESGAISYDGHIVYESATGKAMVDAEGGYVPEGGGEEPAVENTTPRAGLLTACAYDDHEYAAYWQGLITSTQEGDGEFARYFDTFAFKAYRQIKVTVEGVAGAIVYLFDRTSNNNIGRAVTDNAGVAYLFAPSGMSDLEVQTPNLDGHANLITKLVNDDEVTFTKEDVGITADKKFDRIQVMFVIDTTGSMGDEISYLKEEIDDVIGRIKAQTNAEVTLAIMVYRDEGDEYVTDYSDFSTDVTTQQAYLKQQDASGGGDFPEAVDVALTEAVSKQWMAQATKIIVHVADAPAHDNDVENWSKAATKAAEQGIRIVSVASSGIDKKTEYFFRSQSLVTGGVYVWLTDDSGIGGEHLEGTVEKRPVVEPLNDCLVRVMAALHTGDRPITVMPEETTEEQPTEQQTGQEDAQTPQTQPEE